MLIADVLLESVNALAFASAFEMYTDHHDMIHVIKPAWKRFKIFSSTHMTF